ncbi:hypothetical protein EYF80_023460 [Liparis tanakae]|uniref:Uncharacterized protein n=1 Tax=Liparis tanakae TaxID=230148 RepID=A0A4Z2HMZ6_9TELE|nr:hypothetical protein EYF80_023460 [Liparis tanakae]
MVSPVEGQTRLYPHPIVTSKTLSLLHPSGSHKIEEALTAEDIYPLVVRGDSPCSPLGDPSELTPGHNAAYINISYDCS